jgi:hypothetical protein
MHAIMQSQHDWIISLQALSPEVQVMVQPFLVISHLHMPMVMLQQQTTMPFIMQQTEHMLPAIIEQRFCIMAHAVASSQVQVIFMPPCIFSIFIVQRGAMTMFGVMGVIPVIEPGMPMPGAVMPVAAIGFIIAVTMGHSLCR